MYIEGTSRHTYESLNIEGDCNSVLQSSSESVGEGKNSERWQEVRKYLDPNPQLKGVDTGHPLHKVVPLTELRYDNYHMWILL